MSEAPQHWRAAIVNGVRCLVPTDEATEAWLKRRKVGEAVAMKPDHIRNAERSALYWATCATVAENHAELTDRVQVSDTLKQLAGLVNVWSVTLPDGEKCFWAKPRSIAFQKMTEEEFVPFMEKSFRLIESHLWPGVDVDELRKEAFLRSGVSNGRN